MFRDTSYALIRRLDFIEKALRDYARQQELSEITVADIGCGTGELLTIPLSIRLGQSANIYAYEPEAASYAQLCEHIESLDGNNLFPIQQQDLLQIQTYDAIIVSEVIEHVQNPTDFLRNFRKLLKRSGIMIITTPNGYGIFEIEMLLFNSLELIGLITLLRSIKRNFSGSRILQNKPIYADTLAVSPHINFFTLGELQLILQGAGLSLTKIEGRNLAAGPFSDKIIDKSNYLIELNSRLGKILPLALATDWMLIAENNVSKFDSNKPNEHKRSLNILQKIYIKYKKWLNLYLVERRCGPPREC